ncbi:uncharacterized protein CCDC7 isoform X2 [Lithobates pipiens]
MESSELLNPNMIKKLIISRHLKDLDEKRLANFKKALCQLKPRRGAVLIKMENLKNKSIEEIVDFIFRCHTEKRGASTINKTLKEINENQIRMSMEKALRDASKNRKMMETKINEAFQSFNNMETEKTEDIQCSKILETEKAEAVQCSKNMDTEENEASQSNVIKVKQVFKIASITLVPACDAVPCSETPTKKIKRDQGVDAVPGPSNHREATTSRSKNEMHSPVHHPLKEEPQPQVILDHGDTISHKQLGVAPSHTSSKDPPTTPPQPSINQSEPSESEKSLPNIGMEKEIGNIMATHLKTLGEDGIRSFKYYLSLTEAPFEKSKIQTRHIKDKSVEEMVELIISRHTMRHAQATVEKVLDRMDGKKIKMFIVEDISKDMTSIDSMDKNTFGRPVSTTS